MPITLPIGIIAIFQLFSNWLSVEITDYTWLNHTRTIKTILKVMALLFIILYAIALSIFIVHSQEITPWSQYIRNWHTQISQTLQRNAYASIQIIGIAEGENWTLVRDSSGNLEPLMATEAQRICADLLGSGWQLPTIKQLQMLHPHPQLSHSIYIWAIGDHENLLLTSLNSSPIQSGNSYRSYKPTDLFLTLCYKEKQ